MIVYQKIEHLPVSIGLPVEMGKLILQRSLLQWPL